MSGDRLVVDDIPDGATRAVDATGVKNVLVTKANGATVTITGRPLSIVIEGVTNSTIEAETVIAAVEIVRCTDITFKLTGAGPTVQVDVSKNVILELVGSVASTSVVTSKTENISTKIADGTTAVIPDTFVTKLVGGKWVSTVQ